MDLLPAFLLGFLGSLHCIGMCGPLALALPIGTPSTGPFLTGRLLYNLGRIATYAVMGAVAGVVGRGIALVGVQQVVSIVAGVLLIGAYALPSLVGKYLRTLSFLDALASSVQRMFGTLLQRRSFSTMFFIGIVNGLLPCGLVYAALATSALTGDPVMGALSAAVFGFGTFPMMFIVSVVGQRLSSRIRTRIAKIVPVAMIILGTLFILRGMNLGIPMISPKTGNAPTMDHRHH